MRSNLVLSTLLRPVHDRHLEPAAPALQDRHWLKGQALLLTRPQQ
jgi:hypothetical protein